MSSRRNLLAACARTSVMAVSGSGLATLIVLCVIGPLAHLAYGFYRKFKNANRDVEQEDVQAGEDDREQSSGPGYVLGLLGYAIGIGNIWRFPYLCGKHGGFAFVIAYLCMLFFVSLPLFFSELGLGHQTRKSTVDAYRSLHPRWLGLGVAQGLLVTICSTYYNVVIAYALMYVAGTIVDPLPWLDGGEDAAARFWKGDVLGKTLKADGEWSTVNETGFGGVQWRLAVALLVVQIINLFAIGLSKKTLEKVTWVTVVGPIVLLIILLIQALQLEGASDGLEFYLGKLEWSHLEDFNVWAVACSQILFSLSPGFGTAISLSSTAPPKQDVYKTMVIVGLSNSAFSLVGGFAVFSILGNLAKESGQDVAEVASAAGPGLAFIAIAEGMKTFGAAKNVMSVFFFLMLAALGVDSSFAWVETTVVILQDMLREKGIKTSKLIVTLCTVVALYLVGLIYCTSGGNEMLDVVDMFIGTLFLLFGCGLEVIALRMDFKFERLLRGIKAATATKENPEGRKVPLAPVWGFIFDRTMAEGPIILFAYKTFLTLKEPYGDYPTGMLVIGWLLLALCIVCTLSTLPARGDPKSTAKGEPNGNDDSSLREVNL